VPATLLPVIRRPPVRMDAAFVLPERDTLGRIRHKRDSTMNPDVTPDTHAIAVRSRDR